ncbi:UNVERIFIED_CONTAM: hypothetical protein FKN15_075248 [Acipenser sinensis]
MMESLKTTRKPLDLEDINTLLLDYHEGMDPLEEDQLDEKQMMEEGRDEEEKAVPDEPQPSTSTVNMATTDADHATSCPPNAAVHIVTTRQIAGHQTGLHPLTIYTPAHYTLAHTTASTPDASVEPDVL